MHSRYGSKWFRYTRHRPGIIGSRWDGDYNDQKKACNLLKVNWGKLLSAKKPSVQKQDILLIPVALELDEQWSFVGNKSNQRWLWLALNHHNSEVLAYTFGDRTDNSCKQLQRWAKLLDHFFEKLRYKVSAYLC